MSDFQFKTIAYFWASKLLYITTEQDRGNRLHEAAPCRVLCLGLNGPIKVTTYHDGVKREMFVRSVLHDIHSDYSDQFSDNVVCNIFIDPASSLNETLLGKMTKKINGVAVEIENEAMVLKKFQRIYQSGASQGEVGEIIQECYGWTEGEKWQAGHIDKRVVHAIDIIKANLSERLTAAEIASEAGVSESRLFYLFKRDLSMSMSRYILWVRFVNFANIVLEERNLLRAALRVGFWDAAHMARTFRKFAGAPTSKLLRTVIKSKFLLAVTGISNK